MNKSPLKRAISTARSGYWPKAATFSLSPGQAISMSMRYSDYVRVEKPELGNFAEQDGDVNAFQSRFVASVEIVRTGPGRLHCRAHQSSVAGSVFP
jgi:hypothetical protein